MALKAYRGMEFEHTHENLIFNALFDLLDEYCSQANEDWLLLGNVFVGSRELDALVIKPNAVIALDFKDYGGSLQFSEDGPWMIEETEVRGGASANPYQQLKRNKSALLRFFNDKFPDHSNWGHIAAMVVFHQPIEYDSQVIPPRINRWFHISDIHQVLRDLRAIVSREISLNADDTARVVELLGIEEFHPAGIASTNRLDLRGGVREDVALTPHQRHGIEDYTSWLRNDGDLFQLVGMVSTGKRTLLPLIVHATQAAGLVPLVLAPNARIAERYKAIFPEAVSIYTWLYSSQASRFDDDDQQPRAIHDVKSDLALDGKLLLLVEAHLLSDQLVEFTDRRYGSGRLVSDLLQVVEGTTARMIAIGDPYQLPRGSSSRSLLADGVDHIFGLDSKRYELSEQFTRNEEPDALEALQVHLAESIDSGRFNLLPTRCDERLAVQADGIGEWKPDPTASHPNMMFLCGTHDQVQKINRAAKAKLGHRDALAIEPGDRLDFYNRTPVLAPEDGLFDAGDRGWVAAGETALVESILAEPEVHFVALKGRKQPVKLEFQVVTCRVPGLGQVDVRCMLNFTRAGSPELTTDEQIALQVFGRQKASNSLEGHRERLPQRKDPLYKAAQEEFRRVEHRVLQEQGYVSAGLVRIAHGMTVHRGQGRTWPKVCLLAQRSASSEGSSNQEYFRWLYTATICADDHLTLYRMPRLTPLSDMAVSRSRDFQVGPFPVKKGVSYDSLRQPTEQESNMPLPAGFSNVNLLPFYLAIRERTVAAGWSISEWREHPYQVIVKFVREGQPDEATLRFHYDKQLAITNLVFVDGDSSSWAALNYAISTPFKPEQKALEPVLKALVEGLDTFDFKLNDGRESNYLLRLTFTKHDEAIEFEVNVNKLGRASSLRIRKATSQATAEEIERALKEIA